MNLGIAGKVVFFTGGSKGMGRIAAKMLAQEGCAPSSRATLTAPGSRWTARTTAVRSD